MKTFQTRLLLTTFLCVALAGCTGRHSGGDEDESAASNASAVVAVKTAPVIRGDMETVVTATGSTDAIRKEKIITPIAGTLLSLKVLEGTPVHRGDLLAVIQPKETRAAITGAGALLRAAGTDSERREA